MQGILRSGAAGSQFGLRTAVGPTPDAVGIKSATHMTSAAHGHMTSPLLPSTAAAPNPQALMDYLKFYTPRPPFPFYPPLSHGFPMFPGAAPMLPPVLPPHRAPASPGDDDHDRHSPGQLPAVPEGPAGHSDLSSHHSEEDRFSHKCKLLNTI